MDKYKLQMAVKFKRDVKRCKKRGLPLDELWTVVRTLLRGETLDKKYKAHILTGDPLIINRIPACMRRNPIYFCSLVCIRVIP